MPGSASIGIPEKKASKAANPPAEAPIPTTGKPAAVFWSGSCVPAAFPESRGFFPVVTEVEAAGGIWFFFFRVSFLVMVMVSLRGMDGVCDFDARKVRNDPFSCSEAAWERVHAMRLRRHPPFLKKE